MSSLDAWSKHCTQSFYARFSGDLWNTYYLIEVLSETSQDKFFIKYVDFGINMRHWHNYMVSKCNFWWFFSPESRPLWTKYTTPHIVTLFSGQKRDLPFSESRTKYAFTRRFCFKTTTILTENSLNNFVKKNLRCKYNILYLLQTSIIFINIAE